MYIRLITKPQGGGIINIYIIFCKHFLNNLYKQITELSLRLEYFTLSHIATYLPKEDLFL